MMVVVWPQVGTEPHYFGTYRAPHNPAPLSNSLTVRARRVGNYGYPGSEFRPRPEAVLAEARVGKGGVPVPEGGKRPPDAVMRGTTADVARASFTVYRSACQKP